MQYVEVKDNCITGIYCGEVPEETDASIEYLIIEDGTVTIGDDIRIYSDVQAGIKKPLSKLVEEKLITIPEGKKLNEAGTDFVDMTEAEKVAAGILTLKDDEKIEGDYLVKKSEKELYEAGLMSKEAYNAYIDTQRQEVYRQEADPLGMQVLRGDIEKTIWLEKIEAIKNRYPKVE